MFTDISNPTNSVVTVEASPAMRVVHCLYHVLGRLLDVKVLQNSASFGCVRDDSVVGFDACTEREITPALGGCHWGLALGSREVYLDNTRDHKHRSIFALYYTKKRK